MSETTTPSFDPLHEARTNANGERARFYDAIGTPGEYQDKTEFRQANADFADYLASRPYMDDAGRLHDPETGKFMAANESDDDYYDRIANQNDDAAGETSSPYASIRQLAQEIRILDGSDSETDKKRQKSLEGTLINRLDELSEKYGWSKETAERHLNFLFRKIYERDRPENGVTEGSKNADKPVLKPYTIDDEPGVEKDDDSSETFERYDITDDADDKKQDSGTFERYDITDDEDEHSLAEGFVRYEIDDEDNEPAADRNKNENEANEPVEQAFERYEIDEEADQPERRGRFARAKQKLQASLGNPMLRLAAWAEARRVVGNERNKRHARTMAIGAAALTAAMVGTKIWLSYKGHQVDGHGTLLENPSNTVVEPDLGNLPDTSGSNTTGPSGGSVHELSNPSEAYTVRSGEGWYQTLKEMGVPKSQWQNVLQEAGPYLEREGWAYNAHGEWRISQQGQLPESVMTILKEASAKNGYRLAS